MAPNEPQPEAIKLPAALYQQVVDILLTLPAGQVFNLLDALRAQAEPLFAEAADEEAE